jgi:UDP-glucose 4-epimerase
MFIYAHEYHLNMTALRYANVYGPRQNPLGEAGVVAIFSDKMLHGEPTFIFGDGEQTRDYVFVEDIATANLTALSLNGFNTINLGTGVETDVLTIFDTINRFTGNKAVRQFKPQPLGEVRRSVLKADLAKSLLNWSPKIDLDEGLQTTVEFFRNRL